MSETIEIKSCPMCGNDAPAPAPRCTCGYVFSSTQPIEAVEWEPDASSGEPGDGWRNAGSILAVIGAIALAYGLFSGISVDAGYGYDDVVNLGLMFEKGAIIACGLTALTMGTLCLGVGAIVKAIGRNR